MSKYSSKQKKLADKLQQKIKKASTGMQSDIYLFVSSESYLVLGYQSFKSWAKSNEETLGTSYDSLLSYYHTARVTGKLFGQNYIGEITPYVLKPTFSLPEEALNELKLKIKKKFKTKDPTKMKLTNKKVNSLVEKLKCVPQKSNQPEKENKNKVQIKLVSSLNQKTDRSVVKNLNNAITETLKDNQKLRLCQEILKAFKTDSAKEALKTIKAIIKEL